MKVKHKKHLAQCSSPLSFGYNDRSELSSASLGASPYAYDYDNIGNHKTAQEITEEISYDTNNINQYSSITHGETPFVPLFDADGNQSLVQSSTGIWALSYNAESRPISFTKIEAEQTTIIECGYDYMGRRYMKKVSVNGLITLHHRYLYRGYLQIACVDLTRNGHPALWLTMWDPSEPVATRPLAIQKNATWYSYGHDLTKNITELYHTNGTIASSYDYTPFGVVTATATGTEQPYQWSSEYHDTELGLVYYNYRHYNPKDGRWINRDPIAEQGGLNLYGFVGNNSIGRNDFLGLAKKKCCKCRHTRMKDNQYCEQDKVKNRDKVNIKIYYGHCNGVLPDKVQDDKTSIRIGMVTCYANDTLAENVKDPAKRLKNNRPKGNDLLPKNASPQALKEEIAAAKKESLDICQKQGGKILEIQIKIVAADKEGNEWLNIVYPGTGSFKLVEIIKCENQSCASRGGIEQ